MEKFELVSSYKPTGDQPQAINKIVEGIEDGLKYQTILGVTGSGKTFTMANIINNINRPTLVIAHNKTLAAQLCNEFREFFPRNRVEYFVSYYDYYQPEAYIVSSDTYIEKDMSINEEIDKLRHSATCSLFERNDVIVVASVSCIYGLGEPENYSSMCLSLRPGDHAIKNEVMKKLLSLQYQRNEIDFKRGTFRSKGDILDVIPASRSDIAVRFEFFGDEIDRISEFDAITGAILTNKKTISLFPASHFVTADWKLKKAIENIRIELGEQLEKFKKENKLLEHQRLEERTNYDMEMLEETGFCRGIENYSRHIALKGSGETPSTLIDFFGDDYLLVIDESHVTVPQVRGMYNGDRARKEVLVDYGFRLPSALDNRPLKFDEFEKKLNQVIYVSATPGDYELERSKEIVEQIIRPTGLLDPKIEVRPTKGQIDDLVEQIYICKEKNARVLITTLTIRMAEELTNYLKKLDIKVAYLHSEVKTLERMQIIRDLRLGKYDVLVGINLLREGIDIPEVELVAIMDADKQGFLRSERSLIQTIGRAARNQDGRVIMYADEISESMSKAISETERRREIQEKYNKEHHITPKTIIKEIREAIANVQQDKKEKPKMSKQEKQSLALKIETEMKEAAKNLDFERAMELRDALFELKSE